MDCRAGLGAVVWKFNIPRNPESTSADTGHNPESTSADTGAGSRVNLQTAQSQPALTENPRRTPEVYKPLKQNTGCSHCLKTPMQANTYLGNSRQHKKTTSFKKTKEPRRLKHPLNPRPESHNVGCRSYRPFQLRGWGLRCSNLNTCETRHGWFQYCPPLRWR